MKIFFIIICALLFCVPFSPASYAEQKQKLGQKRSMVILGDSIAAGYGLAEEESYAWKLAQAHDFELLNFAFDGNDSVFLRWDIVMESSIREAIVAADVIIISIGGNDFLLAEGLDGFKSLAMRGIMGDHSFMPPIWDAFSEQFAVMITEICDLNPEAMLIVQTLYNSALPIPFLRRTFDIAVGGVNDAIFSYLEQHPNTFFIADIYTAFNGRSGMIARDMVHPTVAGHEIIAHVISDIIAETQTPLPSTSSLFNMPIGLPSIIFLLCIGIVLCYYLRKSKSICRRGIKKRSN